VRILDEKSFDCLALRAQQAARATAPTDLHSVSVRDPLGDHTVIATEWLSDRAVVEALAAKLGGIVVTASGSGPRLAHWGRQ
jgi:hypothetical protein